MFIEIKHMRKADGRFMFDAMEMLKLTPAAGGQLKTGGRTRARQ